MKIDLKCPVEVWRCRLPEKPEDPCEITLFNLGAKKIVSVEVTLILTDAEGRELSRVLERTHDLSGEPRGNFVMRFAVPEGLMDPPPAKVEVSVEKAWWEDGTVWRRGRDPLTVYRTNALPNGRELERLRFAAGENAIGYPEEQENVWMCVCGRPNPPDSGTCVRCGRDRRMIFENFNRETVREAMNARQRALDARARAVRESASSRAGNDGEKISRRRSHPWLRRAAVAAVVLALLGFAAVRWGKPWLDYRAAIRAYESGDADTAIAAFERMGDYADAGAYLTRSRYLAAEKLLEANTEESLLKAKEDFLALGAYDKSAEMALEADYRRASLYLADGRIAEAKALFTELGDYRDSAEQVTRCAYEKAVELQESGDWTPAREAFLELGDYEDSAERAVDCVYAPGKAALESGDPDTAIALLSTIPEERDADELLKQAHYMKGQSLFEAGQTAEAGDEFLLAGDYADAADQARQCIYAPAVAAMESGDWLGAAALFEKIPGWQDADEKYRACVYAQAKASIADREYVLAEELLAKLPEDYEDVADLRRECAYRTAQAHLDAGEWDEAIAGFAALGEYSDSAKKQQAAQYGKAAALSAEGDYVGAIALYQELDGYRDSADLLKRAKYDRANQLMSASDWSGAEALFAELGDYRQSAARLSEARYFRAEALYEAGSWQEARAVYAQLGDYADAPQKVLACDYAAADKLAASGDRPGAAEAFAALGDYADSRDRARELWYTLGAEAEEAGNNGAAVGYFARTEGWKDSAERVEAIQDEVYAGPAELAQAALDAGNPAAAASILSKVDLKNLPERYAYLNDLFLEACWRQGKAHVEAGTPDAAWPYLQRCRGYRDADALLDSTVWNLLGTWRSEEHTLILRKAGTLTMDGVTGNWALDGYTIRVDGADAFKVSAVNGDRLTLRDVRKMPEQVLTLQRTAWDELAPLPEVPFSTATDLPAATATDAR